MGGEGQPDSLEGALDTYAFLGVTRFLIKEESFVPL